MIHAFPHEKRAVTSLALLYVFRMLGLFMVLPVMFLYGENYSGSSPQLLGLALGVYGFSQALLQIPFGLWSDRWGRKPVIAVGLGLFALGSVVAALSESVYGLILGRFLQGGGAIAAAVMAMAADLTSEQNRTKAMAVIGASIGFSFVLALVLGPKLAAWGGMAAIFWLTAGLAVVGLLVLCLFVPSVKSVSAPQVTGTERTRFAEVWQNPELLRLNFGIFSLHFVMVALFSVLPGVLEAFPSIARDDHSWVYLWTLLGSFIAMLPIMIVAERKKRVKWAFVGAIVLLGIAEVVLIAGSQLLPVFLLGLFLFFMAFNFLEANLPSLVSKTAPARARGTATGVYSSSQFLGVFLGGLGSGFALSSGGSSAVFALCIVVLLAWLGVAAFMRGPQQFTNIVVPVAEHRRDYLLPLLAQLPGVAEVSYVEDESAAFLRVDERLFQRESLLELEAS